MAIALGPGQRLEVVSRARDAIEVVSTWDADGTPGPAHLHPEQVETFMVLEGVLTIELEHGAPVEHEAGERIVIPAGVVHRMWNASAAVTRASWRVEPALRTLELWRAMGGSLLAKVTGLVRFRREMRLARLPERPG